MWIPNTITLLSVNVKWYKPMENAFWKKWDQNFKTLASTFNAK